MNSSHGPGRRCWKNEPKSQVISQAGAGSGCSPAGGGGDHETRSDVTMTTTHVGGTHRAPAPSLLPPRCSLLNHQQGPKHREDHMRVAVVLLLWLFPPFFSGLSVSEQRGGGVAVVGRIPPVPLPTVLRARGFGLGCGIIYFPAAF